MAFVHKFGKCNNITNKIKLQTNERTMHYDKMQFKVVECFAVITQPSEKKESERQKRIVFAQHMAQSKKKPMQKFYQQSKI